MGFGDRKIQLQILALAMCSLASHLTSVSSALSLKYPSVMVVLEKGTNLIELQVEVATYFHGTSSLLLKKQLT